MRNTKLFKKALSVVVAAAMTVTVGQTATFAGIDTNSKGVSTYAADIQICVCRTYMAGILGK